MVCDTMIYMKNTLSHEMHIETVIVITIVKPNNMKDNIYNYAIRMNVCVVYDFLLEQILNNFHAFSSSPWSSSFISSPCFIDLLSHSSDDHTAFPG